MWTWINCYLSGRHDFGMWCEPGAIFLRCIHCGKRSSGWAVDPRVRAQAHTPKVAPAARASATRTSRVLPFDRAAAR